MSENESVLASPSAEGAPSEATAAPESGTPAPVADAAAPPAQGDGPPRGPDGKFISAGHAGDSTATQPPAPPVAAPATDPSAPAVAETTSQPNASPNAAAVPQPFTFRASGQRVPLEGATYEPGKGLSVPEAALPQLRRMLAHGYEYATQGVQREREYKRQIAELQAARETTQQAEDAELSVYKSWFVDLLSDGTGAKLLDAVQNFGNTSALLAERAKAARLEKEIAATRAKPATPAQTPEAQQQQLVQSIVRVAGETLEEMRESGEYAALTDEDWKALGQLAAKRPALFYAEQEGEAVFDAEPLQDMARERQALRAEASKRAQEVARATKYNTQRQAAQPPPAAPKAPAPPVRPQETEESIAARQATKWEKARQWEREVTGI